MPFCAVSLRRAAGRTGLAATADGDPGRGSGEMMRWLKREADRDVRSAATKWLRDTTSAEHKAQYVHAAIEADATTAALATQRRLVLLELDARRRLRRGRLRP